MWLTRSMLPLDCDWQYLRRKAAVLVASSLQLHVFADMRCGWVSQILACYPAQAYRGRRGPLVRTAAAQAHGLRLLVPAACRHWLAKHDPDSVASCGDESWSHNFKGPGNCFRTPSPCEALCRGGREPKPGQRRRLQLHVPRHQRAGVVQICTPRFGPVFHIRTLGKADAPTEVCIG